MDLRDRWNRTAIDVATTDCRDLLINRGVCAYTCLNVCQNIVSMCVRMYVPFWEHVCPCVCYVRILAFVCTVCLLVYVRVCLCVHAYNCVYVHVHVCTHMHCFQLT